MPPDVKGSLETVDAKSDERDWVKTASTDTNDFF